MALQGPRGVGAYIPSIPIKPVILLTFTALIAKLASDLLYWKSLDQTTQIDCSNFQFNQDFEPSSSSDPFDLFCFAMNSKKETMKNKANGFTSSVEVINSFKNAAEQGLTLGKKELCRPSTFYGVKTSELEKIGFNELQQLCCPDGSTSICPWEPLLLDVFQKGEAQSDLSTNDQGVFPL